MRYIDYNKKFRSTQLFKIEDTEGKTISKCIIFDYSPYLYILFTDNTHIAFEGETDGDSSIELEVSQDNLVIDSEAKSKCLDSWVLYQLGFITKEENEKSNLARQDFHIEQRKKDMLLNYNRLKKELGL